MFELKYKKGGNDQVLVFNKTVVFHNVGLLWLIQSINNTDFDFEHERLLWVQKNSLYNPTFFSHL